MEIQSDLYYPRYLGKVDFRSKNDELSRSADNGSTNNKGLTVLQKSWAY